MSVRSQSLPIGRRAPVATDRVRRGTAHVLVVLFMLSLIVPPEVAINIGTIRLPAYRVMLLLAAAPCLFKLLAGRGERLNLVDVLVILFTFWSILALFLAHGIGRWQFFGLTAVETLVPYLIARLYIRTHEDMDAFIRLWFRIILFILPFALLETLAERRIIRDVAGMIFGQDGVFEGRPPRLGLHRAYGPFEHPIHYGLFCATILGMLISTQSNRILAFLKYIAVGVAVFCSLSSGPLLLFVVQTGVKLWDVLTRSIRYRWRIFAVLIAAGYIVIDLLSSRTPFHVIVTYLTLRLESAYNRIHIFNFGMASVQKYPIFGIGLNEWERPRWMSTSVDNFWLVIAMRYGIPAFIFLVLALTVLFFRVARAPLSPEAAPYRTGWVISMAGMIVAGATVHFWTELYSLFMFMVGCWFWIVREAMQEPAAARVAARTQARGPAARRRV